MKNSCKAIFHGCNRVNWSSNNEFRPKFNTHRNLGRFCRRFPNTVFKPLISQLKGPPKRISHKPKSRPCHKLSWCKVSGQQHKQQASKNFSCPKTPKATYKMSTRLFFDLFTNPLAHIQRKVRAMLCPNIKFPTIKISELSLFELKASKFKKQLLLRFTEMRILKTNLFSVIRVPKDVLEDNP